MSRVAAVLVTRNAQRWIGETIDSVGAQTRQADALIVVDDHSTDGTVELVHRHSGGRAIVQPSASKARDRVTRIAQNFQQGIRACADYDVVVLGDHDDIWHAHRIEHQAGILDDDAHLMMVASDGRLVDESGVPVGGTLRDTFAVPCGFNATTPEDRMRVALRHLISTGGSSAVRPGAFDQLAIPEGWLHDRWWSLVATAREGMLIDDAIVIDYRLSAGQQVGLDSGSAHHSAAARVVAAVTRLGSSVRKLADLRRELAPLATPRTGPELGGVRLVRNLL